MAVQPSKEGDLVEEVPLAAPTEWLVSVIEELASVADFARPSPVVVVSDDDDRNRT